MPFCEHLPGVAGPVPASGKQGLPTHVYAVAALTDGSFDLEVMTMAEVNEVRQRSKQPKGLAWGSADMPHGEMAKKTVLHRICKRLDLCPDARDAVDRVEVGYDFDAPALPPPRPDRPTAGADGLSMYDSIYSEPEVPKAPELAPPPDVPNSEEDAAYAEWLAQTAEERKRATMKSDLIDLEVRLVQ